MIPDAEILARLAPDTIIQVGIPAGALLQALSGTPQGQRTITTRIASRTFGWAPTDWARWARDYDGRFHAVDPPWREGKVWRLPREWCEAVHDELRKMRKTAGALPVQQTTIVNRTGNYGPSSARRRDQGSEALQDGPRLHRG